MSAFIFAIPMPLVHARWLEYRPMLERAVEADLERKITIEGMLDRITASEYQLLEIRQGDALAGICIVTHGTLGNSSSLFVVSVVGEKSDTWLKDLVQHLEQMARGLGYVDGVLFCGRPGWIKKLSGLGFKTILVTMARGV